MKKRRLSIYILIITTLVFVFLFYKYFINIYETTLKVEPQKLYADNQSLVKITIVPVNSFGWRALFRTTPAIFEIIEGKNLVEIKTQKASEGELTLKAKWETGKVIIKIKSAHSLFPMVVEIPIHPNFT